MGIGGNTGTSGNTGSGGAGVAGSGGNAGTAGTAGNAGSAGTAGNAGSAGGTPMEITGWTFEDYRGDFNAYPVTPPARGGVVTDSPNGHPGSCLYATLGFKGANEEMRVGVMFSSPRTLTRKTLSAEVFVAAGWTDLAHLGKIRLYLITGAKGDQYAEGPTIDLLIGGTWNMITLDPAAPAVSTGAVDTSLVRGLGVSILSADGPSNTTLVVYVDNVLVHDAP